MKYLSRILKTLSHTVTVMPFFICQFLVFFLASRSYLCLRAISDLPGILPQAGLILSPSVHSLFPVTFETLLVVHSLPLGLKKSSLLLRFPLLSLLLEVKSVKWNKKNEKKLYWLVMIVQRRLVLLIQQGTRLSGHTTEILGYSPWHLSSGDRYPKGQLMSIPLS